MMIGNHHGLWGIVMNFKIVLAVTTAFAVLGAVPAFAKKAEAMAKGVYCEQGGENIFFPGSSFKADVRAKMRKGQKVKVNIAGFGPVSCVVV